MTHEAKAAKDYQLSIPQSCHWRGSSPGVFTEFCSVEAGHIKAASPDLSLSGVYFGSSTKMALNWELKLC